MTGGRNCKENDIDRIFRTAAFGMRLSHKEEFKRRLLRDIANG